MEDVITYAQIIEHEQKRLHDFIEDLQRAAGLIGGLSPAIEKLKEVNALLEQAKHWPREASDLLQHDQQEIKAEEQDGGS